MSVEVAPASLAEAPTIANLMELYLYEFSAISERDVEADGRFGYHPLASYWTQDGRYPFLIRVKGVVAGFALVIERSQIDPGESGHAIAEFFVLRKYRRRGVGRSAALVLFGRFPGPWWVGEPVANAPAHAFWRAVIGDYTGGGYDEETWEVEGERGIAQVFDSAVQQ